MGQPFFALLVNAVTLCTLDLSPLVIIVRPINPRWLGAALSHEPCSFSHDAFDDPKGVSCCPVANLTALVFKTTAHVVNVCG